MIGGIVTTQNLKVAAPTTRWVSAITQSFAPALATMLCKIIRNSSSQFQVSLGRVTLVSSTGLVSQLNLCASRN